VRVACCIVLLFAGTLSAYAQAISRDRMKATEQGISKTIKIETIPDRTLAASRIPPNIGLSTTPALRSSLAQFTLGPFRISKAQLETVSWSEISGWTDDDHSAAFETFVSSCKPIVRGTPLRRVGQPFYAALQSVCRRALIAGPYDASAARDFFEQNFRPMRIARLGESTGLLTGYHEPIIVGSRVANSKFNVPVYRKPADLARRDAGAYHDRTAIEEGALAGRNLEIVWLEDPTDLLFAEMEGSARIKL
jgi:hypothetical protein